MNNILPAAAYGKEGIIMAAKKHKEKHLSASDRSIIMKGIQEGASKAEIASRIGADPTTVAKEIKLHRMLLPGSVHPADFPAAVPDAVLPHSHPRSALPG